MRGPEIVGGALRGLVRVAVFLDRLVGPDANHGDRVIGFAFGRVGRGLEGGFRFRVVGFIDRGDIEAGLPPAFHVLLRNHVPKFGVSLAGVDGRRYGFLVPRINGARGGGIAFVRRAGAQAIVVVPEFFVPRGNLRVFEVRLVDGQG